MTSFSNVRFSFDGSLKQAYINFFLLPLLMLISIYGPILLSVGIPAYFAFTSSNGAQGMGTGTSIGFVILIVLAVIISIALATYLFGLIKKRNTMYMINGTQYGQGRFFTELETSVFIKILFKTIGLAILMLTALSVGISIITQLVFRGLDVAQVLGSLDDPSNIGLLFSSSVVFAAFLAYLCVLFGGFIVAAYWKTRQRNYIVNNTTLDNKIALASTLKARKLAWVMVSNVLLIIVTLGFGIPWAKVRMARYIIGNTQVDTALDIDGYVSQQQQYQSSLGDQIGDAFDVDLGLAI